MTLVTLLTLIGLALCGVVLFLAGWFAKYRVDKLKGATIEEQSAKMREEAEKNAELLKRDKLHEVKEEHLKLKTSLESDFEKKRAELTSLERKVRDKEHDYNKKLEVIENQTQELQNREQELTETEDKLSVQSKRLNELLETASKKLEEIAGVNREDALKQLREELIERAKNDAAELVKDIRDRARIQANREAKEMIVQAIQRSAADHSAETTVTVVNIPNDDVKGRIIGREGRNIRSFEASTGVEVIIDDTPEAVTLSGFDPYRREVARIALEKLIADGRIHPARIEELVKKAEEELDERIIELGERACVEANVDSLHPELTRHLGILHYRTSYGQNVLRHSVEVSKLTALMAVELGLDSKLAARAGLIHDIGKSIDRNAEGTHTELGVQLAKRCKEPTTVVNAIASHHDDVEATSLISCLVQAADAISGARPGARRDSLEGYIQRLDKLEKLANRFSGVSKTFALQAGREIRVMVEHDKVTDAQAEMLANDIATKIQEELEYPGQIKVMVIREFRSVEYAR